MAFISDESILEVKRAADIYEVVHSYLPGLKKAGANYKALCPFHEERTPSFNVHPEKQIFKCFGCGKAGDAISFVMEMDKVDYPEAIHLLAQRSGIQLRYKEGAGGGGGPRREDLHRVNEWAAGLFRKLLSGDEAAPAREYLRKRGVTPETEETFRLGYSPGGWDGLITRARKAGFDDSLLLAAGLVIEREGGGTYDRFRGRLMFPIWDARGKVIGFGARALGDDPPKYINTSETAIFSKGRNFYGLHLQREDLERERTIRIVEGYFDVILPYQHGVRGLVATLGTALTRDHLKVLRRYVDRVVLVFDGDEAGRKANERGLDLLLGENADVFVSPLPPDEDPCDVVVNHGADTLRRSFEKPQEIFEFLVDSLQAKHGTETPAAKTRLIGDLLERIGQIPDAVKREVLVKRVSERFGIEERTLKSLLSRPGAESAREPDEPAPSGEEAVGRELLTLLLNRPEAARRILESVAVDRFPGVKPRAIAKRFYANPQLASGDLLALIEDPAERSLAASLLGTEVDAKSADRRLKACLEFLSASEFMAHRKEVKEGLKKAATPEEERQYLAELYRRRQQVPNLTRSLPRP